jgi:hypothetical protein
MAIALSAPRFSFVQFSESSTVQSSFPDIHLCLPVYDEDDVYFQFVIQTDTEEEADELCDIQNNLIEVGIVQTCSDDFLVNFTEAFNSKPQRFRIGPKQILYNWQEGLPGFATAIDIGECFMIKILINETYFCSNCFQRIGDPCYTSVVEYGNDENAFGFNYCNSEGEAIDEDDCDPTIIQFTNQTHLAIPYTASLQAKYGNIPSVQVWIYDESSELVNMGVPITFDAYPPTLISVDLGGPASGVLKLM